MVQFKPTTQRLSSQEEPNLVPYSSTRVILIIYTLSSLNLKLQNEIILNSLDLLNICQYLMYGYL